MQYGKLKKSRQGIPPGRCEQDFRIRRGFPVIRPGTARLPRPRWGLAMTNLGASCRRIHAAHAVSLQGAR